MFELVLSIGCAIGVVLGWNLPLASWHASYEAFTKLAAGLAQVDWTAYYRNRSAVIAQQWPSLAWQLPSGPQLSPSGAWQLPSSAGFNPTMQWAIPTRWTICPSGAQGGPQKPSGEAQ
jgi:hypothetical protein